MKILSPAGNFESLKTAVFNGADEVYLGVNDFNARNNINGFNLADLKQAVDFAHFFNVKVQLALNILFKDDELQSALNLACDAYNLGVDAIIVQDVGLAYLLHKHYPQIELHASTQMGLHNLEGVLAVKDLGFKRVVLARETPLNEIKCISDNADVEIEYFAQGALCVSFSGNCYLSSYMYNLSGNRGKCKQLCRLPYTFCFENKELKKGFLLSAKDFCMADKIKDLQKAGVDVIKIEGRARRPAYVGISTQEYRNLLNGESCDLNNLKLAFNREYTPGYFNGNSNIISDKYNNHIGLKIGKVKKVNNGKRFNEIYFTSSMALSPKSTFKFFYKGEEIATITAFDLTKMQNDLYKITSKINVLNDCDVHLILDYALEEKVLSHKKLLREINIEITAKQNLPITATLSINGCEKCEITGEVCIPALNRPLTLTELTQCFSKSQYFKPQITAQMENIFLPKSKLNEFRRNVYERAYNLITNSFRRNLQKIKINIPKECEIFNNFEIVENYKKLTPYKNVVYSPEKYDLNDIKDFINACKDAHCVPYLDTPNFALAEDINLLKNIILNTGISIIANNYYALCFNTNLIIGAGLNVFNKVSAKFYNKQVILAENSFTCAIKYPYMTLRHCPMKENLNCTCENCLYKNGYYYKMQNGKILKLKRKKMHSCTFYLTD